MHSGEAPSCPDIALEGGFLLLVEEPASGVEEHDHRVPRERPVGEQGGVLGRTYIETVLGPERLQRRNTGRNRAVTKAARLRENQHAEAVLDRLLIARPGQHW